MNIRRLVAWAMVFVINATVSACGGGGSSSDAGGAGGGSNAATYPRFAYVANYGDNSVSSYVVDAVSGRLKYTGKAAANTAPRSVVVDPSGKYELMRHHQQIAGGGNRLIMRGEKNVQAT